MHCFLRTSLTLWDAALWKVNGACAILTVVPWDGLLTEEEKALRSWATCLRSHSKQAAPSWIHFTDSSSGALSTVTHQIPELKAIMYHPGGCTIVSPWQHIQDIREMALFHSQSYQKFKNFNYTDSWKKWPLGQWPLNWADGICRRHCPEPAGLQPRIIPHLFKG